MKLYADYTAFKYEGGIKHKVVGRVEIEYDTLISEVDAKEMAKAKIYSNVPSLRGTPLNITDCGFVKEEVAA